MFISYFRNAILVLFGLAVLSPSGFILEASTISVACRGEQDSSGEADSTDVDSADIFSTIWELPESHVSVTTMGDDGKPLDPQAQVVVNEQGKAGNCLDDDHAPQPLFAHVDESVFQEPTFKTLIALLDNFTAAELKREVSYADTGNSHWVEVDAFLDAVFDTKPMHVAIQHIQEELVPGISLKQIRDDVRKMWFESFTNHYGSAQPYCVGFEHVFVGEDESKPGFAPRCQDRVGGYHSWVKFYLDQKSGKANYLGYDYPGANVKEALSDASIATIVMRWSPTSEEDGAHGNALLKKPGGFFVGSRPELEIAFGTLAMYAQHAGKFDNIKGKVNHHRVRLGDNLFDLVMHPQSIPPSTDGAPTERGYHIRTLYPKFRGRSVRENNQVATRAELPTQPHNDAQIRIHRALINPVGQDESGEWVELKNVTENTTFDLSQWRLSDQSGRNKELTGTLKAGSLVRIKLIRTGQDSMMLRNGNGWILLYEGDVRQAAVSYSKPTSGKITQFSD